MTKLHLHSVESFFKRTYVAIIIVFCLKWGAVVGLNLIAQISDRISPDSV